MANCEYLLLSISCEMNADQSLFVMDLNERQGDSTNLYGQLCFLRLKKRKKRKKNIYTFY